MPPTSPKPSNIYECYEYYLEAADLKGKSNTVIVERGDFREIYNPRARRGEWKPVIWFVDRRKAMVLNKTQAETMAGLTGSDAPEDWAKASIILTPAEINGKQTIAIMAAPEK